jgi:hypothetical protein
VSCRSRRKGKASLVSPRSIAIFTQQGENEEKWSKKKKKKKKGIKTHSIASTAAERANPFNIIRSSV